MARILDDEQLVEEELIPVFEEMIQETETVQMGIIKNLALFLQKLPDLCRVSYLPILHEILHSTNRFNWRLRQYLAIQLPDLVALPPKSDAYRTLFPTIMTLLQDPVASVRRESFKGVSALLNAVYAVASDTDKQYPNDVIEMNKQNLEEICRAVNSFITSDKCQHRQLWLELALQLLKDLPRHFFEKEFLAGILILVCDRVLNVRLACAMLLDGWEPEYPAPWEIESEGQRKNSPWLWFLARADIKEVVQRLSQDDNDVYLHVSKLKVVYPDITFASITCRGKKVAPGGSEPVPLNATPIPINVEKTSVHHDLHKLEKSKSRSNSMRLEFIQEQPVRGRSGSFELLHEHPPLSPHHSIEELEQQAALHQQHAIEAPLSPTLSNAMMHVSIEEQQQLSVADEDEPEEESEPLRLSNAEEIDFVTSINDPNVVEELDIIDGIIPGLPTRSPNVSVDHDEGHRVANLLKHHSMEND